MFNRPLLTPKTEEADLLEKQQEDSLVARMKMFVHLRQDLERVSHSITCTGIHSIKNWSCLFSLSWRTQTLKVSL